MTMDQEARTLVAQLVAALQPLEQHVFTREDEAATDAHSARHRTITLGALRAANAAAAAGRAALAAAAGQ